MAFSRPERVGPGRTPLLTLLPLPAARPLPLVGVVVEGRPLAVAGKGRTGRGLGVDVASCWRAPALGRDAPAARRRSGDSSGASRALPSVGVDGCGRGRSAVAVASDTAGRGSTGSRTGSDEPDVPAGRCRSGAPVGAGRMDDAGRGLTIGCPGMA